jgi:hypothetical protein
MDARNAPASMRLSHHKMDNVKTPKEKQRKITSWKSGSLTTKLK